MIQHVDRRLRVGVALPREVAVQLLIFSPTAFSNRPISVIFSGANSLHHSSPDSDSPMQIRQLFSAMPLVPVAQSVQFLSGAETELLQRIGMA
jgi:hypothetical protein